MSYSRWTNSVWYTFWSNGKGSDGQQIDVLSVGHKGTPSGQEGGFFKELSVPMIEADRDQCSRDAFPKGVAVDEGDRLELLGIFDSFLDDIAREQAGGGS